MQQEFSLDRRVTAHQALSEDLLAKQVALQTPDSNYLSRRKGYVQPPERAAWRNRRERPVKRSTSEVRNRYNLSRIVASPILLKRGYELIGKNSK